MKTKLVKLSTWMVLMFVIAGGAVALTNWLTDGFTTVGPFLG